MEVTRSSLWKIVCSRRRKSHLSDFLGRVYREGKENIVKTIGLRERKRKWSMVDI